MSYLNRVFVLLLVVAAGSCASTPALVDVKGSCADVHGAQVCTWAKTQGTALVEIGALVPIASIENAPADVPMGWPPVAVAKLALPESVKSQSGLSEFTMYWEPMGHPPGAYLTPHFDFHFYTISGTDRDAIDCADTSRPASLPDGYGLPDIALPPEMHQLMGVSTLVGACVPKMGMHSLLASEIESKEKFRGTMVVGYYGAKPIFIEPMVAKTMLMEKKSFDLVIPKVPGIGAHPTKFRADWDAAQNAYRFTFSAFAPAG